MVQSMSLLTLTIGEPDSGQRLDKILATHCADESLSRTRLKDLILEGRVQLNGVICTDPSLKIKTGMVVTVDVPAPVAAVPQAENIALDIVYEDDALIVLNKPAGLVVHPGAGHGDGTLVNALLHHCGDSLSGIGGVLRPGIVHRLDRDTSGLMLAAKSDRAHHALSAQLADRTLSRQYKAIVWNVPMPRKGTVDKPIGRHPTHRQKQAIVRSGGRNAVTHYAIDQTFGDTAALVNCTLETGRTHQVRVHMASLGHPLIGDPLYGLQTTATRAILKRGGFEEMERDAVLSFPRQALHAWKIGFIHPLTDKDMRFEIEIPTDMKTLIISLESKG
mgnify:CR=1 FL=1